MLVEARDAKREPRTKVLHRVYVALTCDVGWRYGSDGCLSTFRRSAIGGRYHPTTNWCHVETSVRRYTPLLLSYCRRSGTVRYYSAIVLTVWHRVTFSSKKRRKSYFFRSLLESVLDTPRCWLNLICIARFFGSLTKKNDLGPWGVGYWKAGPASKASCQL